MPEAWKPHMLVTPPIPAMFFMAISSLGPRVHRKHNSY
jgi:hypothetical protein